MNFDPRMYFRPSLELENELLNDQEGRWFRCENLFEQCGDDLEHALAATSELELDTCQIGGLICQPCMIELFQLPLDPVVLQHLEDELAKLKSKYAAAAPTQN